MDWQKQKEAAMEFNDFGQYSKRVERLVGLWMLKEEEKKRQEALQKRGDLASLRIFNQETQKGNSPQQER